MRPSPPRSPRAFTLLELLVVVGLIALLVAILVTSLQSVRSGAGRAESLSSLRQMVAGYSNYASEHRGKLMPGYLDQTTLSDLQIKAELASGTVLNWTAPCAAGECDAGSYVWRLLPYLDHGWETLLVDYDSRSFIAAMDSEIQAGTYGLGSASGNELGLAAVPSFGLNSIYVGGDTTHGGNNATAFHPWSGSPETIAATGTSEVKNPARLIVFGPVGRADTDMGSESPYVAAGDLAEGFMELRAPLLPDASGALTVPQWTVGAGGAIERTGTGVYGSGGAGLPISRWGRNQMPVANLDGSATIEQMSTIGADMSRWSPFLP